MHSEMCVIFFCCLLALGAAAAAAAIPAIITVFASAMLACFAATVPQTVSSAAMMSFDIVVMKSIKMLNVVRSIIYNDV